MRRPTPRPRASGATHMRLISGGDAVLSAPQPIGSPRSRATMNTPESNGGAVVLPEAGLEALVDLGEVALEARPRRLARRVLLRQHDDPRREQPLDDSHRVHESRRLALAQRGQERAGQVVAALAEPDALGAAGRGGVHAAAPPVGAVDLHAHQAFGLQRPQQPAEVAGVQAQARAELADVGRRRPPPTARGWRPAAVRGPDTSP